MDHREENAEVVRGSSLPPRFWETLCRGAKITPDPDVGWSLSINIVQVENIQSVLSEQNVCQQCKQKWESSNLVTNLSRVDWRRDVVASEDIRLEPILKVYLDAKRLRFSDGCGKVLSTVLTLCVITHGICNEHRKCFLMNTPGSMHEAGGMENKIGIESSNVESANIEYKVLKGCPDFIVMMDLDYPGRNTVPLLAFVINEIKFRRSSAGLDQLQFYLLQTQLINSMVLAQTPTTGLLFGPDLFRTVFVKCHMEETQLYKGTFMIGREFTLQEGGLVEAVKSTWWALASRAILHEPPAPRVGH